MPGVRPVQEVARLGLIRGRQIRRERTRIQVADELSEVAGEGLRRLRALSARADPAPLPQLCAECSLVVGDVVGHAPIVRSRKHSAGGSLIT